LGILVQFNSSDSEALAERGGLSLLTRP